MIRIVRFHWLTIVAGLLIARAACGQAVPVFVDLDFGNTHQFTPPQQQVIRQAVCAKLADMCNKQFCHVWSFDPTQQQKTTLKLTLTSGSSDLVLSMELLAEQRGATGPHKWKMTVVGAGEVVPKAAQFLEDLRDTHVKNIFNDNLPDLQHELVTRVPVVKLSSSATGPTTATSPTSRASISNTITNLLATLFLGPAVMNVAQDHAYRIQGKCGDGGGSVFIRVTREKQEELDENGKKVPVIKAKCTKFEQGQSLDDISNHLSCINGFQIENIYLIEPNFAPEDDGVPAAMAPPPSP
jgi:hypothetical protein